MIERFLVQTTFTSEEDFREHLEFKVKENFNFAYDVMDAWAEEAPDKLALLWTSERGEEKRLTFAELKKETDQTASYFQSLGIGRGDMVMLILKRHYQWWLSMMALCKIGAVAIPARWFEQLELREVIVQVAEDLERVPREYCGVGGVFDQQIELAYPGS